jgi:hypothetical protein
MEKIRARYPRAYERWTEAEDRLLEERCQAGLTVSELAARHQRQPGAIRSRLKKQGLVG